MPEEPSAPFFLIVADHDRGVFTVEGPMTSDQAWRSGAQAARARDRRITCGPTGSDRAALADEYARTHKLAGVPPWSIMRPRG